MRWELIDSTGFARDRGVLRDQRGAEVWVVVVKATFRFDADGTVSLADEQAVPLHAPIYRGRPGRSSLLYGEDMVPTRLGTGVILNGTAHAPGGRPVQWLDTALQVGDLRKSVRVFGDRLWQGSGDDLHASEPRPFTTLPLEYERAYGGVDPQQDDPQRPSFDPRNPVGIGFARTPAALRGRPLPNLERADQPIASPADRPEPAGYGAIAPHWSARVRHAGTYDDAWQAERFPLLPEDFDPRFHQCAPDDQVSATPLRGGETVRLTNLSPAGDIRFVLPNPVIRMDTVIDGRNIAHRPELSTVIIEPDHGRLMMVWHTALPCHRRSLKIERTVIFLKPREAVEAA